MSRKAATTFRISSWDEKSLQEFEDGEKLVRVRVKQKYSGELQGEGRVEYLMHYSGAKNAQFVGYETFTGQFNGNAGRFVMAHNGRYSEDIASSEWEVVPGSGGGKLSKLSGSGSFSAGHGGEASVKLRLRLA